MDEQDRVFLLPIDQIDAGNLPWSHRAFYHAEEINAFAERIRQIGRLPEPVLVRPVAGRYQLCGSRLPLLAAERVGLRMVPVRLVADGDFHASIQFFEDFFAARPPLLRGWVLLEVKRILEAAGQPSGPRPIARAVRRPGSFALFSDYMKFAKAVPWSAVERRLAAPWWEGRERQPDVRDVIGLSVDALHDIALGLHYESRDGENEDERDRRLELAVQAVVEGRRPEDELRRDPRVQTQRPRRSPRASPEAAAPAASVAAARRPSRPAWHPTGSPHAVEGLNGQLLWQHQGSVGDHRVRWFTIDRAGLHLVDRSGTVLHYERDREGAGRRRAVPGPASPAANRRQNLWHWLLRHAKTALLRLRR